MPYCGPWADFYGGLLTAPQSSFWLLTGFMPASLWEALAVQLGAHPLPDWTLARFQLISVLWLGRLEELQRSGLGQGVIVLLTSFFPSSFRGEGLCCVALTVAVPPLLSGRVR